MRESVRVPFHGFTTDASIIPHLGLRYSKTNEGDVARWNTRALKARAQKISNSRAEEIVESEKLMQPGECGCTFFNESFTDCRKRMAITLALFVFESNRRTKAW